MPSSYGFLGGKPSTPEWNCRNDGYGFWDSEVSGLTLTTTGTIAGNKRGELGMGMGMVGWVGLIGCVPEMLRGRGGEDVCVRVFTFNECSSSLG